MALAPRQPFAELCSSRVHALSSAKNRQNAITKSLTSPLKESFSPLKPTMSPLGKRKSQSQSLTFGDDDSENVDPSIFSSPSKKSKHSSILGDSFSKPSSFVLTSPSKPLPTSNSSTSFGTVRKSSSLSLSLNTSTSAPSSILKSRGSPKHKRVGLLFKHRTSSSSFRRVDPPSSVHSSPGLPFSIDAALSGTIPGYTPKQPLVKNEVEETMPKSWFFDIHEDTPEQEAANLMEHSASVLDISSDDDMETKRRNDELERGKENIPPPDFMPSSHAHLTTSSGTLGVESTEGEMEMAKKMPRLRKLKESQDAMDEDRRPLADLPAEEFYGEGLDATSYVTVDIGLDNPSGLSKEFDFSCPTPEKSKAEVELEVQGNVEGGAETSKEGDV